MKLYKIQISEELNKLIEECAKKMNVSVETFIARVLSRYAIDPHIMENEDVKRGYEDMAEINLEISNL